LLLVCIIFNRLCLKTLLLMQPLKADRKTCAKPVVYSDNFFYNGSFTLCAGYNVCFFLPCAITRIMSKFRMINKRLLVFFMLILYAAASAFSQVIPLPNAYAHNDYWHKRPLFDALDNGFTHIEADIYLRRSRLLVAHRPPFLGRRHSIETLYLQPLLNRLTNCDRPLTALDTIVLTIDIKSKGEKTYAALRALLHNYASILSSAENGKVVIRNLTLVLTGHRPLQQLKSEELRYVFADADLSKLNRQQDCPEIFATASCKYSRLIKWKGKGLVPLPEQERLQELVDKAHASGTKVRLWGSPDNETVWRFLRNCGVDLINTDKLLALKRFFIKDAAQRSMAGK
jgi:Glycerophosphoryl diester phosphodiesterase family